AAFAAFLSQRCPTDLAAGPQSPALRRSGALGSWSAPDPDRAVGERIQTRRGAHLEAPGNEHKPACHLVPLANHLWHWSTSSGPPDCPDRGDRALQPSSGLGLAGGTGGQATRIGQLAAGTRSDGSSWAGELAPAPLYVCPGRHAVGSAHACLGPASQSP